MHFYSIIIPVYNRAEELNELLESIVSQDFTNFEVVVVDDGSKLKCEPTVNKYNEKIKIKYIYQSNTGQGFARNTGLINANGDFFIILDSDALLEPNYLTIVNEAITKNKVDLFGGPDKDHINFSPIQKAISYAMTSIFTTGGIRGNKKNLGGTFHPRSFNMGFSRKLFETIGGFKITRMGEDIEFSIRAINAGFKSMLIQDAFIYHKRRSNFHQFYYQLQFFGRARINITRFFPKTLKLVHFFPLGFVFFLVSIPLLALFSNLLFSLGILILGLFIVFIFVDSYKNTKSVTVAFLSILASIIQLFAYGLGFLKEGLVFIFEKKGNENLGTEIEYPS